MSHTKPWLLFFIQEKRKKEEKRDPQQVKKKTSVLFFTRISEKKKQVSSSFFCVCYHLIGLQCRYISICIKQTNKKPRDVCMYQKYVYTLTLIVTSITTFVQKKWKQ